MNARNLDEGMIDRRARPEDALLAVRKPLTPSRKDHLARHHQAGGVEVRLPLLALLGLARPADERDFRGVGQERRLRRVLNDEVLMQPPMAAALVRQREAVTAF